MTVSFLHLLGAPCVQTRTAVVHVHSRQFAIDLIGVNWRSDKKLQGRCHRDSKLARHHGDDISSRGRRFRRFRTPKQVIDFSALQSCDLALVMVRR
jgi:hypothetical protein